MLIKKKKGIKKEKAKEKKGGKKGRKKIVFSIIDLFLYEMKQKETCIA